MTCIRKLIITSSLICICVIICFRHSLAYSKYSVQNNDLTPLLLAHYMPWYQTPAVSGHWGWHWTMNYFDPEKTDSSGRREIASHYYPLTGPYDSKDKNILEYQVLLMKLSGIDGVLVDWYGMEDFADYATLNESTSVLFTMIQKARLYFAIVYEDQTIQHMIEAGYLDKSKAADHGKKVMQYLQQNWFETSTYLKIDNRPVLLTFGPQYFSKSSDWELLFSDLPSTPLFFTLDNRLSPVAAGAYPWPPMWKVNANHVLTQGALDDYLNQFYAKASNWDFLITSAFPGFRDIYKEAGVSSGYGFLDSRNGSTFRSTLQLALDHHPDVIQLVTWNDYGEGTMIEPTIEFEYQYLEIVQEIRAFSDSSFQFQRQDITIPLQIYKLRQKYTGNPKINSELDNVFDLIVLGQLDSAKTLIESLSDDKYRPKEYSLLQNYPNPFNSSTTIHYVLSENSHVTIKVTNTLGEEIKVLVNGEQPYGEYQLLWDASNLASGLYFCTLQAGDILKTNKLLLIK